MPMACSAPTCREIGGDLTRETLFEHALQFFPRAGTPAKIDKVPVLLPQAREHRKEPRLQIAYALRAGYVPVVHRLRTRSMHGAGGRMDRRFQPTPRPNAFIHAEFRGACRTPSDTRFPAVNLLCSATPLYP